MMNNDYKISDFKVTQRSGDGRQHVSDVRVGELTTRIEIIGEDGREVVKYAPEGCYYRRSVQDNGRTVKFFVEKKNGKQECPGVGKCQDPGCPAHYASDEVEKK